MKNTLIVLPGPTCVGKTDVSIHIAKHFKCDIISADSRQFYRELKKGTAPPSENQLQQVRHHFIGFLSVNDYYSASMFEQDVLKLLPSLFGNNNLALMTGGSGMYIDAVCHGIDDIPDVDKEVRKKYLKKYKEEGLPGLRLALKVLDPDHYKKADLKNPKRIIRALEISESTGRPYSAFLTRQNQKRDFRIIKAGLKRPREELYERINARVDAMINSGLEEEAHKLYCLKDMNALNTLGYKEFFTFFEGRISRDKAIDLIKRNTRRYAKRQMTWWSRDKEIMWFDADKITEIISYLEKAVN